MCRHLGIFRAVVYLAFITLPVCHAGVPATAPSELSRFAHVNDQQLHRDFIAVFEKNFEILDHRFELDQRKIEYWVVDIRPRRAGWFVVRYDFKADDPIAKPKREELHSYEYLLQIGEKGQPRIHYGSTDACRSIFPLADVGDTIRISVFVHPSARDHQFFSESQRPGYFEAWQKDVARRSNVPDQMENRLTIDNQLNAHLELIGSSASSFANHSGNSPPRHVLGGVFKAVLPGSVSIHVEADYARPTTREGMMDPMMGMPGMAGMLPPGNPRIPLHVMIVPREDAITLSPLDVQTTRSRDEFRSNSGLDYPTHDLIMREGDLLSLRLFEYEAFFPNEAKQKLHPPLTVMQPPQPDSE